MGTITDLPTIEVGHAHDLELQTGCTALLTGEEGAVAGVDIRGGAPGTRETELLQPGKLVEGVHAILLTGGSAFGLDAASGVVKYLYEQGRGHSAGSIKVPIVPAAVIFDLGLGSMGWPDLEMGYQAAAGASDDPVPLGNVGAGTGATVGNMLGRKGMMRGGIGSSSCRLPSGLQVGALVVVNALGDVYDHGQGEIVAGLRDPESGLLLDSMKMMKEGHGSVRLEFENTTLGVVATDARLRVEEAQKVAQMAHNGLARTIRPAHTMMDGDTIFALSVGERKADVSLVGALAAEMVEQAILSAFTGRRLPPPQEGIN